MIDLKIQLILNTILKHIVSSGKVEVETVSKETGLSENFIKDIIKDFGIELDANTIKADPTTIIIKGWMRGFDIVQFALSIGWHELEKLCGDIFKRAGYEVALNFRFKEGGKRHEIDLIALHGETLFVIDCKRWSRTRTTALKNAALAQKERAGAFSRYIARNGLALVSTSNTVRVYPMVISVFSPQIKVYEGVLVVNLYQLKGFLAEVENYLYGLDFFETRIPRLI